jgi:hypothetical protein
MSFGPREYIAHILDECDFLVRSLTALEVEQFLASSVLRRACQHVSSRTRARNPGIRPAMTGKCSDTERRGAKRPDRVRIGAGGARVDGRSHSPSTRRSAHDRRSHRVSTAVLRRPGPRPKVHAAGTGRRRRVLAV